MTYLKPLKLTTGKEAAETLAHLDQYVVEVKREKHPTPFHLTFSPNAVELIRIHWKPLEGYPTWDDFERTLTTLQEARKLLRSGGEAPKQGTEERIEQDVGYQTSKCEVQRTFAAKRIELEEDGNRQVQEWLAKTKSVEMLAPMIARIHSSTESKKRALDLEEEEALRTLKTEASVVKCDPNIEGDRTGTPSGQILPATDAFSSLIEEAKHLSEALCFTFMPHQHVMFASARLQEIMNVAAKSYATHDIAEYFRQFIEACMRHNPGVHAPGYHPLDEASLVAVLCRGLTAEYEWNDVSVFVQELNRSPTVREAIRAFSSTRVNEEGFYTPPWIGLRKKASQAVTDTVMLVRTTDTRPTCEHCGRKGHKQDKCYTLHPELKPGEKPTCEHCGRKGHQQDKCWKLHPDLKPKKGTTTAVIEGLSEPTAPDTLKIQGWDVPLMADRGSGFSLVTPEGAKLLEKLDPTAIYKKESFELSSFNGTKTRVDKTIIATATFESKSLEWAVQVREKFLVVQDLVYPAIIGRTLLDSIGLTNEALQRRPTRPDDETLMRDSSVQSLDDLVAYAGQGFTYPKVAERLNDAQREQVLRLIHSYKEIFGPLPENGTTLEPFTIDLTKDRTVKIGPRPLAKPLLDDAHKAVQELLDAKIVEPAEDAAWSSPILMVPKADRTWRVCVDYRALNALTRTFAYPMPSIPDLFQRLARHKYYAVFDWTSGFHQLMVSEKSRDLTAFAVPNKGLFRFRRMPFGVKNGPPIFQQRMEKTFGALLHNGLEVFIDDHVVYADSWDAFKEKLTKYFDITKSVRGRIKGAKSVIGEEKIGFLGQILTPEGISIAPDRKEGLENLGTPKNPTELRSLNGLLQYFRDFVPNFGELADPMYRALKKTPYSFDEDCRKSLKRFIEILTSDQVLHHIDYNNELVLRTDASNVAVGGMLLMVKADESGTKRELPIAYFSRRLQGAEKNYSTTDQEALGIFSGMIKFEQYLKGVHFTVETDHRNLIFMSTSTVPRIIRWRERLYDFDFTVRHIPGAKNVVADTLSRLVTGDETDGQNPNPNACQVALVQPEYPVERKAEIMEAAHGAQAGHFGIWETHRKLVEADISWPRMHEDIREFIAKCPVCQKRSNKSKTRYGKYGTQMATKPFDTVAIDTLFVSDVDPYAKYIFVMVDVFTRWVELAVSVDKTGTSAAEALMNSWICRYGPPRVILSDQGTEFLNKCTEALKKPFGVDTRTTFGYHPEGNGLCERMNQEVLQALRAIVQPLSQHEQWASAVPFVQYQLNTTANRTLGVTPYSMVFGRFNEALLPELEEARGKLKEALDLGDVTPGQYAQELTEWLAIGHEAAAAHQDVVVQKRLAELNHGRVVQSYEPGDLVLLVAPFCLDKLAPKMLGPFEIIGDVGNNGLLLENLEDRKRVTVPKRNVRPFRHSGLSREEMIELAGQDKLERLVEKILEHKREKNGIYYLVKWHDDPVATWEPEYVVRDLEQLDNYLKSLTELGGGVVRSRD